MSQGFCLLIQQYIQRTAQSKTPRTEVRGVCIWLKANAYFAAEASEAGAVAAEAASAGAACVASSPCFSPPISKLLPPLRMTNIAKAAKITKPKRIFSISIVGVDIHVLGFFHEQHADHECHTCHDDGVPQAVVHIASLRHDRECSGWQQAAEPTVTDVIRQ